MAFVPMYSNGILVLPVLVIIVLLLTISTCSYNVNGQENVFQSIIDITKPSSTVSSASSATTASRSLPTVVYIGSEVIWKYPSDAIRLARAKQAEYDTQNNTSSTTTITTSVVAEGVDNTNNNDDDGIDTGTDENYFGFFIHVIDASIRLDFKSYYNNTSYVIEQKPLLYYRGNRIVDIPINWPMQDNNNNRYKIVLLNRLTTSSVVPIDIVLAVSPIFEVKENNIDLKTDTNSYTFYTDDNDTNKQGVITISKRSISNISFRGTDTIRIVPSNTNVIDYYTTPYAIYDNVLGRFPDDTIIISQSELFLPPTKNGLKQSYKAIIFIFGQSTLIAGVSNVFDITLLSPPNSAQQEERSLLSSSSTTSTGSSDKEESTESDTKDL